MSDSKTYTWLYDLRDNAMTKDVKEDYVATVRTMRSMTVEDIAQAIVSERTGLYDFAGQIRTKNISGGIYLCQLYALPRNIANH